MSSDGIGYIPDLYYQFCKRRKPMRSCPTCGFSSCPKCLREHHVCGGAS